MPALLLFALLGLNYHRHKRGKSTICSTGRRFISPTLFVIGWTVLTAWIVPHYTRHHPLARLIARLLEAFADDRPDPSNLPEETT